MFISIINDCRDDNARGRQLTRVAGLFSITPSFVGVSSDLDAAGNLIDILDAGGGGEGVVLVNVAPRNGSSHKWGNGSPFCYFRYKETLVLASIEGKTLSLVKKLGIVDSIFVFDLPACLSVMQEAGVITLEQADAIAESQFRSFDFLPRVARALVDGKELPHTTVSIKEIEDAPAAIWWVDNFGNCKTTLVPADITADNNGMMKTTLGMLPFVPHLKDVSDGTTACTIGSSGLGDKRFVEIVVQGKSAAEKFTLTSGTLIIT